MAFKLKRPRLRLTVLLILLLLVGGGLFLLKSDPVRKLEHPEYLSFTGGYVFSIPKDMSVDAHAIQGIQIVHSGSLVGKTIDQVYADNNISLQPVPFVKDNGGLKKYVNDTVVPEQKQKHSPDATVEFSKVDGWDVAKITVKKDNQPLRFLYLKDGKHPVSIVSKTENDNLMKIAQSVTDVEKTNLRKDLEPLKQAAQTTAQQIRDKKADELYNSAAQELRDKNSKDELSKLLEAEVVYSQGQAIINGGSYSGGEFGAVIYFIPLNQDFKPASGALYFKKDGKNWKLTGLQLPNPAANLKNP